MVYEPQEWRDGEGGNTPILAATLLHIEAGIKALSDNFANYVKKTATGAGETSTFGDYDLVDDATDPTAWPDRWQFKYTGKLVQWFNEYHEWRGSPAKENTVGWRLFVKREPGDMAREENTPVAEIVDNRTDRNPLWQVFHDRTWIKRAVVVGIEQVRDGATAAAWKTTKTETLTDDPNVAEHRIGELLVSWLNEVGYARFIPHVNWDAAMRFIRQDGDANPTAGQANAVELVDRRTGMDNLVRYGRDWATGDLVRNGNTMSDVVVVPAGTTDTDIEALNLPAGTVVFEETE